MRRLMAASVTLALAGCMVGPDHIRPETETATDFARREAPVFASDAPQAAFWAQFGDATLEELVAEALVANHDLRVAAARLDAARSLARETARDRIPSVTAGASYRDVRTPESGASLDLARYDAGFDAVWELDFFGRVRRATEAARADSRAAAADLDAVHVAVAADVARAYFELRGLQAQLAVATENVANQTRSLELVDARLEAGRGTEFDTARQRAQLATTQARVPVLEATIAATTHRLAVLTGRQPHALDAALAAQAPLPALPATIAVGTPEALLRRRPDIAAAEARLAAATARVGVATADLFPRVTLFGGYGSLAGDAGDLGSSASERWSFGPSISWAAFDLGRVRARIAARDADAHAALARYEQTVLGALEETETSLVRFARKRDERERLDAAARDSAEAARLAHLRFDAGASDFLAVLDAERTLLEARDRAAASRTETATALIAVYKALGGFPDEVGDRAAARQPVSP